MDNHWENRIPIKITALRRRETKLSPKNTVVLLFDLVVSFLLISYSRQYCSYHDTWQITLLITMLNIIVFVIMFRVSLMLCFNEKKMYETYLHLKDRPVFTLSDYWDILYISKDGNIVFTDREYGGQNRSILIKMERTSTIGKDSGFENRHYLAVSAAYRAFLVSNYSVRRYNLCTDDSNDAGFAFTEKCASQRTNKRLTAFISDFLTYNRLLVKNVQNRTIEYWQITAPGIKNRLMEDTVEILENLAMSSLYKPEICGLDEFKVFVYAFFKLKYINAKELTFGNLPKDSVIKVIGKESFADDESKYDIVQTEIEQRRSRWKEEQAILKGIQK